MFPPLMHIARVLKTLWKRFQRKGRVGSHTLRVTTEGIDKPVFQLIWIAGSITTNGVHAACKQSKKLE